MALVPFSYANPFTDQLQLKERIFTIGGRDLRIQQAWKGDGKGGTEIGFGASVYPAAFVLAEYLERHPYIVRGKRVIELGAGTGFLGIAAAVLGAAEVCLTDGDDKSLRLAESNVTANLPAVGLRQRSAVCRGQNVECPTRGEQETQSLGAAVTYSSGANVNSDGNDKRERDDAVCASTCINSGGGNGERHAGLTPVTGEGRNQEQLAGVIGTEGSPASRAPAGLHDAVGATTAIDRTKVPAGHSCRSEGVFHAGNINKQPPPSPRPITVRKLRWGCPGDMEACHGGNGPWDVVLGSDIAALPYESAYDDLRRTIVSFVARSNSNMALTPAINMCGTGMPGETAAARKADACEGDRSALSPLCSVPPVGLDGDSGSGEGRRTVVVLLAHKRRHVSEEAFFEGLEEDLGKRSRRQIGEQDVHADFRGSGIRLHMFAVDVCC